MSIWNKVLLVLIFLTAVVYALLVSNRFRLEKQWGEKIAGLEKNLQDQTDAVARLRLEIDGDALKTIDPQAALAWNDLGLRSKLARLKARVRGRLWTDCHPPRSPQRENGRVQMSFCIAPNDKPRQIADVHLSQNTPVYLFDSGTPYVDPAAQSTAAQNPASQNPADAAGEVKPSQPMEFLGIFNVDSINEEAAEINISSVGTVTDAELQRLERSVSGGNSWVVCGDRLPVDSPDDIAFWLGADTALAEALPENLRTHLLLPGMSVAEIILPTGEVSAATDGKRYPRDYEELLASRLTLRDELTLCVNRRKAIQSELESVIRTQFAAIGVDAVPQEALDKIGPTPEDAQAFADSFAGAKAAYKLETLIAQKNRCTSLRESMQNQRDLVKKRLDLAVESVAGLQARIDTLLKTNCDLAVKIAKSQFEAADRIIEQSENVTAVNGDAALALPPKSDI